MRLLIIAIANKIRRLDGKTGWPHDAPSITINRMVDEDGGLLIHGQDLRNVSELM